MSELRHYKCEYYEMDAPAHSCLFCANCSDIFWDYTNGAYAFGCALTDHGDGMVEAHFGFVEDCEDFVEDGE